MKNIILDKADVNYLLNSQLEKSILYDIQHGLVEDNFRTSLQIDMDVIEKILDYLSDEFTKHGIGNKDEPNFEGLKLESLIDKFAREFYN
jgi:hypothetical protein